MKTLIITCIFLFHSLFVLSQYWHPLNAGFDGQVSTLKADSVNNCIYAGGLFSYSGTLPVNCVAKWDGMNWDSLGSGTYNLSIVKCLEIFNDTLFGGTFFGSWNTGFAKWNGVYWDTMQGINSAVLTMKEFNNNLYIGGVFNKIGTLSTPSHIAKWDGQSWATFPFSFPVSFGIIQSLEFYNGEMYIGGNFDTVSLRDLCKWDGNSLQPVGVGLSGPGTGVSCMAFYKNELYIGGSFSKPTDVANYIMKWDGNTLQEVGMGLDGAPRSMKVYDDELYIVGGFNHAGSLPVNYIAKWNGTSWEDMGQPYFNGPIEAIEFMNGEMYVGGAFTNAGNTGANYIAKYTGPLTVKDFSKPCLSFSISSNPTNSAITLSFHSVLREEGMLTATDEQGRQQFNITIPKQTARKELDISELASGIYFITLDSESGRVTKKFIKE